MGARLLAFAVLPLSLLLAGGANATSFTLAAMLDGLQVPVVTLGNGTLTGTYDDVTNALTWSGSFSGLTTGTNAAHFHGPAAPGVNAGIQVSMTGGSNVFPLAVTSGSFSGSATITDTQEADLLAGLWYVNIHTTMFPNGEIRGQVAAVPVPEPPVIGLLALGLAGLVWTGRRRA